MYLLRAKHVNRDTGEHTYRRAKEGPLSIEPIYLHTPERIEAFLLLFKMALQIVVLIERTARKNIHERDRGFDGFMPNRKDVRNPQSEYLLKAREKIKRCPSNSIFFNSTPKANDERKFSSFNNGLPTLDEAMSEHIRRALRLTNGKISGQNGAAQLLGINPNTLRSRMRKLGIPFSANAIK